MNNHQKIWGSLWYNGKWGYACCGQFIRNSYCTGETGRKAFEASKGNRYGTPPVAYCLVHVLGHAIREDHGVGARTTSGVKVGMRVESFGLSDE